MKEQDVLTFLESLRLKGQDAAPRYYVTDEPYECYDAYKQTILDRLDQEHYFKVTVEHSELNELNNKVRVILDALNK
jgi:hypothetical protein